MWWYRFHQTFAPMLGYFSFHSQNCWSGLESLAGASGLFSRRVVVLSTSAHNSCLKKEESFPPFIMVHTLLYCIVTFLSTQLFYCGGPCMVYSNWIPISSCVHALSKSSFSLAFSLLAHFTLTPHLAFKSLRQTLSFSLLIFLLKKNSMWGQWCLLQPAAYAFCHKSEDDGELMSKNWLSPNIM